MEPTSHILDAKGRPMPPRSDKCPQCGSGKDKRTASAGFGVAHPVCSTCGHEWFDEVWRG